MLLYNFNAKTIFNDEFDNSLKDYTFEYNDCFCGEKNYNIVSLKTRAGQNFTTVCCKKCGTLRINPYLTESSIEKYYKNLYGKVKRGNITPDNLYKKQKQSASRIFDFLKKYLNKNIKILDFGGGAGGKSYKFIKNNYNTFITDSDKNHMNYALSLGYKEFNQDLKYDLILLIHVIEHISDLDSFLNFIRKIISDNGFLYIEIPYLGGKEYNYSIIDEIHIAHKWYFTKYSLIGLLKKNGFKVIENNDEFGGIIFAPESINNHNIEKLNNYYKLSKKNSKKAIKIAFWVKIIRKIRNLLKTRK